jgi:hypothetical protein
LKFQDLNQKNHQLQEFQQEGKKKNKKEKNILTRDSKVQHIGFDQEEVSWKVGRSNGIISSYERLGIKKRSLKH